MKYTNAFYPSHNNSFKESLIVIKDYVFLYFSDNSVVSILEYNKDPSSSKNDSGSLTKIEN